MGFEQPDEEAMKQWNAWFEKIGPFQLEQVGLMNGREINSEGQRELGWDLESITGYNIVEAESIEDATRLCEDNPFVTSIRVYELR